MFITYSSFDSVYQHLMDNDENSFEDLDRDVQKYLIVNNIMWPAREPTEQEMEETIADAKEHRLTNNERLISDFQDKYKTGKTFNIS